MAVPILDAQKIRATVTILRKRIDQRFPESGLSQIGRKLEEVAARTEQRSADINRPIWSIKILVWLLIALLIGIVLSLPFVLASGFQQDQLTLRDFLELGDPVLNEIIVIGALVFFLMSLETRVKRNRALKALHDLRSIAHVIDMHQLTKDPERVVSRVYAPTELSPRPSLNRFQLRRYLDYCSEMLSLTGKLAAVYVQSFDDSVALSAVNEVESLTTGLSRKIWQKIMILHNADLADEESGGGASVIQS